MRICPDNAFAFNFRFHCMEATGGTDIEPASFCAKTGTSRLSISNVMNNRYL
jgi:hypothetical protein